MPGDVLKIDQAFVSHLQGPTAPAPIVTAIVGVAGALAVGTVAEGVETAEQTAAVAALGCEHAQGFFFARPHRRSRSRGLCTTTRRYESGPLRRAPSPSRPSSR